MPVPANISALSPIPASNSPAGSESPTTTDDYLRAHAAFIAQLRDATNRNLIINGNPLVNQSAVSGTVTLAAGAYGHDMWKAGASGCTYTFTTVAGETTFTISAGSLVQVIEGNNLLSGPHTLSWSGTAQGKIGAGSYSATGVTATVTGGANLSIEFGVGTLGMAQFEAGTVATRFEQRMYGQELALCQRYFQDLSGFMNVVASSAAANVNVLLLPVQMRATPTVTQVISTGTGASVVASLASVSQLGTNSVDANVSTLRLSARL